MATTLPTPLAAALGLVPAVLDQVRRLPRRAVALPVTAISGALAGADALRREYDELADRGERLVATLRGEAVDGAAHLAVVTEDTVEAVAASLPDAAPFSTAHERVSGIVDAVAPVASLPQRPDTDAATPASAAGASVTPLRDAGDRAAEAPKGVPTPKAVEPDAGRVDTAASTSIREVVAQAVESSPAGSAGTPDHDDLPLPDYDHMTLGSLRGRLRALSVDQLALVRSYEKAHADRLPVVTMLDNRIAKLATDASATVSGPVSSSPAPEQLAAAAGPTGAVTPATTDAPPTAPSHGDPTSPAQPR